MALRWPKTGTTLFDLPFGFVRVEWPKAINEPPVKRAEYSFPVGDLSALGQFVHS